MTLNKLRGLTQDLPFGVWMNPTLPVGEWQALVKRRMTNGIAPGRPRETLPTAIPTQTPQRRPTPGNRNFLFDEVAGVARDPVSVLPTSDNFLTAAETRRCLLDGPLDLLAPQGVRDVVVYNRTDCCTDRWYKLNVELSSSRYPRWRPRAPPGYPAIAQAHRHSSAELVQRGQIGPAIQACARGGPPLISPAPPPARGLVYSGGHGR